MSPLPSIVNNRNLSSSRLHKTLSRQAVRKCVKWGISRHQGFPGATLSANALYRASRRTYSDSTLRDSTPFIFYDSRRHPELDSGSTLRKVTFPALPRLLFPDPPEVATHRTYRMRFLRRNLHMGRLLRGESG